MARALRLLVGVVVAAHASEGRAQAQREYSERYFTTADGLPSQAVTSIAETRDGYLWVVSGGLLARFDGKEFRTYSVANTPLLQRRVMSIAAGRGDTLWIADVASALFAMVGGRVSLVAPPALAGTAFRSLAQDADGALYAGSVPDILRLARDRLTWDIVLARAPWDAVRWGVHELVPDRTGGVWAVDSAFTLRRLSGGTQGARTTTMWWGAVASLASGEVLSVVPRGDRYALEDSMGNVRAAFPRSAGRRAQLVDRDGRLWVSTDTSYEVYAPGRPTPVAVLGRASALGYLVGSASGCLWETGLALRQICRSAFRTILEPRRVGPYIARGLRGSIFRWDSVGNIVVLRPSEPAARLTWRDQWRFSTAYVDSRGTVWWSWNFAGGAPRVERTGAEGRGPELFLQYRAVQAFDDNPLAADVVWYAAGGYLFRAVRRGPRELSVIDSAALGGRLASLSAAPDGSAWVTASEPNETPVLLHVRGSQVTRYGPKDGLPNVELRVVRAMEDGSVLVGSYGAGLVRYHRGVFRTITSRNGLAEDVVTSLLTDDAGNLWMGGNQSIHRVSLRELGEFLDGTRPVVRGVAHAQADGIEVPETAGQPGVRDDLGQLWFPTINGIVVADPRLALAVDSIVPEIRIHDLITASDSLPWTKARVRLSRGARRLTVRYAGVTMRNAQALQYQYRIDDVDQGWIEAGRSREAQYNAVGPGRHTFRVRAISAAGVPTPNEATMEFVVPSYFTETPAFYILLLGSALSVIWLAMRLRERAHLQRAAVLSHAVEERTAKLASALDTVGAQAAQLRTLDEAKSRFFANVSHEFRTPLSLIMGPVDDMRTGRFGALGATLVQRLDSVHANAERLLRLVDQLLDIAKLQSGVLKLAPHEQDLVPLLRRLADSFSSLAERKSITFLLACPTSGLTVSCDADQMEKVVGNLVSNAIKFTPDGGTVELRGSVVGEDGGSVVIEVVDTGPGIAPEFQEKVFDRFFQVDDSSVRSHEGTGIGLALVRELVELHKGTVRVESRLGTGSRFVVRIPLARSALSAGRRRGTPPDSSAAARFALPAPRPRGAVADAITVLIVEDNTELLAYLREHLADRYRVLVAENGRRGLDMALTHAPDLIISDIMMPDMDGEALCQAVKADPETAFIPVILLTARASRESKLAGLALGADDYLTKPVDLAELVLRAENLVAARRHVRERLRALNQELPSLQVPLAAPPRDASERALADRFSHELAAHLADADFDVDGLAAAMGMSRTTLYRKLSPLLGQSPRDALREYRLAQAAQWLAETAISVSEVAYGVGFKSVPHFNVSFRSRYGASPTAYRQARATLAGSTTR